MNALTLDQLNLICGNRRAQASRAGLLAGISDYGAKVRLDKPHRLALFLANVLHETGGGRWLNEIWGPTRAQKRYEGRLDLGNTQPGDGKRFMGHGWIHTTGRANHRSVTQWARARFLDVPDFEKNPEKLAEPKWAVMSAFWYWSERVPSRYVEAGNHEMVRRSINGGLNGYSDVLRYFDRAALVLLGFNPDSAESVKSFQSQAGITADGDLGPQTRRALFKSLYVAHPATAERQEASAHPSTLKPSPAPTGGLGALIARLFAAIFGRR